MTPEMERVLAALRGCRFSYTSERDVQDGVVELFESHGIEHEREREMTEDDRIDFWVPGGMGIEVKVQGSLTEVTRQLHRYARHEDIAVLVLLTTMMSHRRMPEEMCGKPIHVVYQSPF